MKNIKSFDEFVNESISDNKINKEYKEYKEWIDKASYEELLRRWRHAKSDDDIFQGDNGTYYKEIMNKKQQDLKDGEKTSISKRIGW